MAYRLFACLLLLTFFCGSCRKHGDSGTGTDNGCITRVSPQPSGFQDSALFLFQANHLSTSASRFELFQSGYVGSPSYSGWEQTITVTPYFNGLPCSFEEYLFFYNGVYEPGISVNLYTGALPGPDISTHQDLAFLRAAFLAHEAESYTIGGFAGSTPDIHPASFYADSCLNATLTYMDAGLIPGSSVAPGSTLTKVWTVYTHNGSLPVVYVEDATGLAWGEIVRVP